MFTFVGGSEIKHNVMTRVRFASNKNMLHVLEFRSDLFGMYTLTLYRYFVNQTQHIGFRGRLLRVYAHFQLSRNSFFKSSHWLGGS